MHDVGIYEDVMRGMHDGAADKNICRLCLYVWCKKGIFVVV